MRTGNLPAAVWRCCVRLCCLSLLVGLTTAQAREIVDMQGRHVQVPEHIQRVFGAAPPINVLLHAVAPETMVGVSFPIPAEAHPYYPPRLLQLPVAGGIFGVGQQMNPETVLALKPDVALLWQSAFVDQAKAEETLGKLGIPVVVLKLDDLADWPAALRFTGRLLERDAEPQARYVEAVLASLQRLTAGIPEQQRPRVYYAEGSDGLATDCNRSFHTEAIELAGGYNVYRCAQKERMGMEKVSLEQVLALAPDIIVTQERAFAARVRQDPRWQGVKAVREGRIYLVPRWPHNWIDRPPSVMRALGAQWLAHVFYPQAYPLDLTQETRKFYRLFLGVDPDAQQIEALFH